MTENETPAQEQEPTGAERLAAAERDRQRMQAQPHRDNLEGTPDGDDRRDELEADPASPEGQQAAMRRGDPVQLVGDEMLGGRRMGTNTTHNESLVAPTVASPGPRGPNFVTGAAGEPVPAGEGVVPERPSVGEADFSLAEAHQTEQVARAPYEQGEEDRLEKAQAEYAERSQPAPSEHEQDQSGPPARSAPKSDWVEHAVSQGADRDEAEAKTKDQLIEDHSGQAADPTVARDGAEGPGVSA